MVSFSSVVFYFAKEVWKKVENGLDHERTAHNFGNMENDLYPMFEGIGELARKINVPEQEIDSLMSVMTEMRQARLNYSEIRSWNFFLAPCYKDELDKADQLVRDFIWTQLMVRTSLTTMEIRHHQIRTTEQTTHEIQQPTLKIDAITLILPEIIKGLNTPMMEALRSDLTADDGDKVLNLNGLTGTGKTTLARQLCLDPQIQGWFNSNVALVSVESNRESIGEQLGRELREKWHERKGLLVLDNVESGVEDLVEHCLRQLPSNSKILAISRVVLPKLGRQVTMTPLGEQDAITLLSHCVRPIGATSCNLPDPRIVRQVLRRCGGSPMAIKMIGRDLRGKQTDSSWEQYLRNWSRQGHPIIPNTQSEWLDHLHNSLIDSEEYNSISENFKDLGLFPGDEIIPVSSLLDMWVQLYDDQDEDGRQAMEDVQLLRDMNLVDTMVQTRGQVASKDEKNEVDNQFLRQHNILRELANRYSREQASEFKRKRLIIEINGNDPLPECLRQQQQRGIKAYLPFLNASMQPRVAARILSITTDQKVTPDSCYMKAAEAQVLVLNLRTYEYRLPEFIKEMKKLKVLIVTTYGFPSTQFKNFKLLGFLYNLERIRLERVTVPCVWKLKKLRKLSLYKCEVKTAFENSSLEFSKAMPNLEELKIEDSADLVELPAGIWNIVNLKKLSITKCCNFTKLPQEIRRLTNLELLRISYCDKFEEMPESISELQSLAFLDISRCRFLRKLPNKIGQLQNLNKLYMPGCPMRALPDSFMDFKNLRSVICDHHTSLYWELVKDSIGFDLEVKTAISTYMEIGSGLNESKEDDEDEEKEDKDADWCYF